jgi:hypothetical protein
MLQGLGAYSTARARQTCYTNQDTLSTYHGNKDSHTRSVDKTRNLFGYHECDLVRVTLPKSNVVNRARFEPFAQ